MDQQSLESDFPGGQPAACSFNFRCHPRTAEISQTVDAFFLEHWPLPTEESRAEFIASKCNLWGCWVFPGVSDDRIEDIVKLNTLMFLLDGKLLFPFPL